MTSIGILTSGGDAPGMNAAIRAVFRSVKMREPDRTLVFFHNGFKGLAARLSSNTDRNVERRTVRGIIHMGGTFLGTGRVEALKPPKEGSEDYEAQLADREDFLKVAAVNLYQLNISSLIVIGGDGSFKGASLIASHFRKMFPRRTFRIIGIPATIDNDLHGTDYSIGYDTALNNNVDALRKIRDTGLSHKRAIILEVMGNTSGWLALQSALAGGASVVAIPEDPTSWDHDRILECLIAGLRRDYRYFIIVVAEGVKKVAGDDWSSTLRMRIESSKEICKILGEPMEARVNSIGHVSRGGRPSAFDNTIASQMGDSAAKIAQGAPIFGKTFNEGNVMVGIYGNKITIVPLEEAIENSPRLVTSDAPLWELTSTLMLQATQPF